MLLIYSVKFSFKSTVIVSRVIDKVDFIVMLLISNVWEPVLPT